MAIVATKPHPIFLAGRWVESPDVLTVLNPADPTTPAGSTFNATPEQYEEAVQAAVAAFEVTRKLPAYERGRILRGISAGLQERREERVEQFVERGRFPAAKTPAARFRAGPTS